MALAMPIAAELSANGFACPVLTPASRYCSSLVALEENLRVLLVRLLDSVLLRLVLPEVDDIRREVQQQHPVPAAIQRREGIQYQAGMSEHLAIHQGLM